MDNNLEKIVYAFLQEEPFFAHFMLNMKILYDLPGCPTAGVRLSNYNLELAINRKFFFSFPLVTQQAILKHEMLHVLLEHVSERGSLQKDPKYAQIKNIAMDCAINQYITNLPEEGITLPLVEKMVNKPLSPFESWEYYYAAIKEEADRQLSNIPDHEFMDSGDSKDKKDAAQGAGKIGTEVIKDAANKAAKQAAGNTPDYVNKILGALNVGAKVNWKQQLRNIIASARHVSTKPTRMRPNRRFELEQPGRKKDKRLVLGVCLDSSGSISDDDYQDFLNEVVHISKSTTLTILVHADCTVQRVDTIRNGKVSNEVKSKRHGSGGTAYQPAIDKCMEQKCDAIVYFGDFDCADTPTNPRVPFIWVGVGNQPPPGNFGHVIRLT